MATSATKAERRESSETNGVDRVLPAGDGRLPGLEPADTLLLLRFGLAIDTVCSHWTSHETTFGDVLTAHFTLAVVTFVDHHQGLADLVDELPLSVPHSQGEVAVGLMRRQIDGVGKILFLRDQLPHARFGLHEKFLETFTQQITKKFDAGWFQFPLQASGLIDGRIWLPQADSLTTTGKDYMVETANLASTLSRVDSSSDSTATLLRKGTDYRLEE